MKLNYLDLFSGIGGFSKGLQDAVVKFNNHFFSEIDKNAISIYQEHFPNAIGVGDVSTIRDVSQFGKIDLITFGFPCQDLSIAGKGRGLEGSRSGLFYEAMRLVRELKPTYFIFENVKGLLTNNGGADFVRCLREIADLGCYDCEWQLVNTSWLLPQNRERVYFIGHLRGKSSPKVFPFTESDFDASGISGQQICCLTTRSNIADGNGSYIVERKFNEKIGKDGKLKSNQHLASCLTGGGHSGGNHSDMDLIVQQTKGNSQGQRIGTLNGNSVCLSAQGGGMGAKTGLYVVPRGNNQGGYKEVVNCPTITKSSFETNNFVCPVLTPNRAEKRQNGRRFKENGEPSFTLTTQDQHGVLIIKEATSKGFVNVPADCGVDLTQPNSKTRRGRLMDKNCNTLTTQSQGLAWYDGVDIRRLTPLECERLQGFPDGWTEGHSDSARYKALGNAVSVPIVTMIAKRLLS